MRYYRYLATDAHGSYSLLSSEPLETPRDGSAELRLLEATDDYAAACKAHRALAERLRTRAARVLAFRRPPDATT
jgi:hypothetical protein